MELEKAIYFSCFTGLDSFDLFSLKDLFESDDVGRTQRKSQQPPFETAANEEEQQGLPSLLTSIFYYLFKESGCTVIKRQKKRQEKPSPGLILQLVGAPTLFVEILSISFILFLLHQIV